MNTSSPLAPSGLLGTIAKLLRLTENLGVEWSHWLHPTNNKTARANFAEYLKLGCPKVNAEGAVVNTTLPEGIDLARLILGNDFISPEEVAKAYGFSYSEDQFAQFADTLPDFETLMWLRQNGYMLVAGPATDQNLLDVRDFDNQLFYSKSEGWYAEDKQTFSRTDMVRGGQWLMLRKGDVPKSRGETWSKQYDMVKAPEYVPNVAEVSYGVTVYRKVRGVYLLPNFWVRTSSVDAGGDRVYVGYQGGQGLFVRSYWDGYRHDGLGVSSARN
jgi:hypothetical protein